MTSFQPNLGQDRPPCKISNTDGQTDRRTLPSALSPIEIEIEIHRNEYSMHVK